MPAYSWRFQSVMATAYLQTKSRAQPSVFRAVIEEYILDRIIGGPQVMRAQLDHLLVLLAPRWRENVELHVLPVSRPRPRRARR